MSEDLTESPQLPSRTRRASRPKLKIPQINVPNVTNLNVFKSAEIPMSAIPIGNANGPLGIFHMYPTKASEFMNKRYENFKDFTRSTAKSGLSFGEKALFWVNGRIRQLSRKWFTHIFLFFVVLLYSLAGAVLFVTVEGTHEVKEKEDIKQVLNRFVLNARSLAMERDVVYNIKLWEKNFKELIEPYEAQLLESFSHGVTPGQHKTWSFWNSMFYCGTIYTTIGYGHISPSTTTGRAITIIYAIFGIPMFLILLADFGKLFTRGIKFVWAFVRRLYYTGSCRRVRKTAPVQEMMKGMQIVYDFAKTRKFSTTAEMGGQAEHLNRDEIMGQPHPFAPTQFSGQSHHLKPPETNIQGIPETPGTPNWSTFEIDDEFNLPISVAISILLLYIFFGAFLYWMWEDWSFFESFYFVFISMSTIGFGDFVPQHPIYMMLSIVYLVFGLALTSMCINVVQEKLSDTFRQASAKLGTTIGLSVEEPVVVSEPENSEQVVDNSGPKP